MSIIYDALKKVQAFQHKPPKDNLPQPPLKPKRHIYLVYVCVAGLGVFVASILFNLFAPRQPTNQAVSNQPTLEKTQAGPNTPTHIPLPAEPKTPPPKSVWVLTGVFFSENQGYALINNRIVKEGDVIEEATVKRISLEEVELESNGNLIKLSTSRSD
jgi:hypothetical protein